MSVQKNEYALECSGSWIWIYDFKTKELNYPPRQQLGKHVRSQSHQGFISQVSSLSKSLISAKC